MVTELALLNTTIWRTGAAAAELAGSPISSEDRARWEASRKALEEASKTTLAALREASRSNKVLPPQSAVLLRLVVSAMNIALEQAESMLLDVDELTDLAYELDDACENLELAATIGPAYEEAERLVNAGAQ